MAAFIKGLDLCERFYVEAVQPILKRHFPNIIYSAGRLGQGSDVLGFDTPTSMDHDWGPRLTLFLDASDFQKYSQEINVVLGQELPFEVCGFSTHFSRHEDNTTGLQKAEARPIIHGVVVTTVSDFFQDYLGSNPLHPFSERDWLSIAPQKLRTIVSGRIFHDGLQQLEVVRQNLTWYPHDMWLYLMANQWRRIDQEEPFVGRCGDVRDDLGSQIVASRLITEVMRLCFLMEKSYAPYFKWFGSAFSLLPCSKVLSPIFQNIFACVGWKEREHHLSEAYLIVTQMHNDLGVTTLIKPEISPFHARPYLIPHSNRFYEALHQVIQSPVVKSLPKHVGAIWQFADSTDILGSPLYCDALTSVYEDEKQRSV